MEVGYFGSSAKGNQGTTIMPNMCLDFPSQAPKDFFFFWSQNYTDHFNS
jgi:hypothetical protein